MSGLSAMSLDQKDAVECILVAAGMLWTLNTSNINTPILMCIYLLYTHMYVYTRIHIQKPYITIICVYTRTHNIITWNPLACLSPCPLHAWTLRQCSLRWLLAPLSLQPPVVTWRPKPIHFGLQESHWRRHLVCRWLEQLCFRSHPLGNIVYLYIHILMTHDMTHHCVCVYKYIYIHINIYIYIHT